MREKLRPTQPDLSLEQSLWRIHRKKEDEVLCLVSTSCYMHLTWSSQAVEALAKASRFPETALHYIILYCILFYSILFYDIL